MGVSKGAWPGSGQPATLALGAAHCHLAGRRVRGRTRHAPLGRRLGRTRRRARGRGRAPRAIAATNAALTPRASSSVIAAWVVPPGEVTLRRSVSGRLARGGGERGGAGDGLHARGGAPRARAQAHLARRPRASPRSGGTRRPGPSPRARSRRRASSSSADPDDLRRSAPARRRRRARSSADDRRRARTAPAMPWPISAGVFGMARTTRSLPLARDDRVAADAGHHAELQRAADVRARRARRRRERAAA